MKLSRDPALITAFVTAGAQLLFAFLTSLTDDQVSLLNGAAAALGGVLVAVIVIRDRLVPAILGFAQAALAAAVGFGLSWTPEQVSLVTAFAAIAVAMFVRTQVTAPVDPTGQQRIAA